MLRPTARAGYYNRHPETSMPLHVHQTAPILRIFDEQKAKDFYVGFLGFTVDWEHRFEPGMPLYIQVSLGGCVLHLSEHHGDACPGSTVFLRVTGLEEYHREIMAKGYIYARPGIEDTFYGSKNMQVGDPFGNRLRFDEKL
jgi:uncharacterized glyoxalase superfamily protein PhnB